MRGRKVKPNRKGKACRGKLRHETREAAQRACSSLAARYASSSLSVYACRYCGAWHVGHKR